MYDSAIVGLYIVPKGFVSDGASVPRWIPIAYATTGGTGNAAAIIHDHAYQTHTLKKATADALYLEAMEVLGEPWWRRTAMAQAVRWFGQSSYDSGPARYRTLGNDAMPPMLPGDLA